MKFIFKPAKYIFLKNEKSKTEVQYIIIKYKKSLFYGLKKSINLTIKFDVKFSPFLFFFLFFSLLPLLRRSNLCSRERESMQSVKQTLTCFDTFHVVLHFKINVVQLTRQR